MRLASIQRACAAACAFLALAVPTAPSPASTLRTLDPASRIELREVDRPRGFEGQTGDFTVLAWFRPEDDAALPARVFGLGDGLRVALDDDAGVVVRWQADAGATTLALPAPNGGLHVPRAGWMLVGATYDAAQGVFAAHAFVAGEEAPRSLELVAPRTGLAPWPLTLGADEDLPAATGRYGLLVMRDERLDAASLTALVEPSAPDYFAAARGPASGWSGVSLALGHAVLTDPSRDANPQGVGAALGDPVDDRNLPIRNPRAGSGTWSIGNLAALEGSWVFVSPFDDSPASFARRAASASLPDPAYASMQSPKAARLASGDAPDGLVRVLATANSRAVRVNTSFYGGAESWTFGGLWTERGALCAGVTIPAWPGFTLWPGFRSTARIEAPVEMASSTATAFASFGAFGSHGQSNPSWPSLQLVGNAAIVLPGGAYVPKARPEQGSRFASAQDPLTVRTLALRFPGAGTARYRGEKAAAQASLGTADGDWTTRPLDSTTLSRTLSALEAAACTTTTLCFDSTDLPVAVGDACFVADGPGVGGISLVAAVSSTSDGLIIELERPLPSAPTIGATVRFGPVDVVWLEHAWAGLAPGDLATYRGVRVEADGGPVAILASECFNPDADGFVFGAVGRAGWGYALQLQRGLVGAGHLLLRGLAPDVVLQFFAHQSSPVESMVHWTETIRREHPSTEIWWCGDPDLDVEGTNGEGTDAWHAWCIGSAPVHGVGAVSAHEHPDVGTAPDRAADGQFANAAHPSARGCALYMRATLDLVAQAATTTLPCLADLDGSGTVEFADLLAVLSAWGACGACPEDLDDDGSVGFADLLLVLGAWGPCP